MFHLEASSAADGGVNAAWEDSSHCADPGQDGKQAPHRVGNNFALKAF